MVFFKVSGGFRAPAQGLGEVSLRGSQTVGFRVEGLGVF